MQLLHFKKMETLAALFRTVFGYHILQRLQRIEVIEDKSNKANLDMLEGKSSAKRQNAEQQKRCALTKIRETIKKDAKPADLVQR